jgi:cytochrome-b5 reductase
LARDYPDRFKLHYTLDRPPAGWTGSTGFIDQDMIKTHVLKNGKKDGTQVLLCGPPPMIKFACIPNLEAVGLNESNWFSF